MRPSLWRLSSAIALLLFALPGCNGCDPDDPENGNGEDPIEVELILDAVVPGKGFESGGTEVRIEGSGFLEGVAETGASASLQTAVRFGESAGFGVQVVSDTVIRVVSPPHATGIVDVRVENPNGSAVCSDCFEYEEDEDPIDPVFEVRIDRISPAQGTAAGGTRVRIEGKGFLLGFASLGEDVRDRTAVLFGDNTAIDFDVIDDRLIDAVTPPGNIGDRSVRVQNPNGEATCQDCFHYFVPVRADVIVPDSAPVEGGVLVTLTGAGFTEGTLVMVGGRSAIAPEVVDEGTLTFFAPPGPEPSAVDVTVLNSNGRDTLRRRFTYFAEPRLASLDPPVGPSSGGTTVRLNGEGLVGASQVTFGGEPAVDLRSSGDDLVVTSPPGEAGTAVAVEVVHALGTTRLSSAFAYVDPDLRDPTLILAAPSFGPVEGGGTVTLVGTGLDHPNPQVRFGAADATGVTMIDANRISVIAPPAAGGTGPVEVQLRNDRGGANLAQGYTYEAPLRVLGVAPGGGPSEGGTSVTVTGEGFQSGVRLRIGALAATSVTVEDETRIVATTSAGSAGPADVVVLLGEGEGLRTAVLPAAYTYSEPLALAQIDPPRGSQAGGTYVVLSGAGFVDGVEVRFGGVRAELIERFGHNVLAVRSPQGALGYADVSVDLGEEQALRRAAFQYYDSTNIRGGASGGPMAGTLNVTALDAYTRVPLAETHVILGADADTPFQGLTDQRGQITFSDPSLVKAVTVTASRRGHEAVTVSRIDARDLTIFMTPNEGEPADMPPAAPAAFINPRPGSGRVCGFKLPPDRVLGPNQREEARVWTSMRMVTNLPPFRALSYPFKVTRDCGEFGMASRAGNVAVYAKYGIVTEEVDPISGQVVESFEPLLMGITRGVEVPTINPPVCTPNRACPTGFTCSGEEELDPENPSSFRWCLCDSDEACGEGRICNAGGGCQVPVVADIVLNMHLDQDVPVRLVNPPSPPDGSQRVDGTYAYLELGGEGALFVTEDLNTESEFVLDRFPRLPGDGFVFLNMSTAGGGYPLSLCYRREIGELSAGVSIGPMQPMTRIISPAGGVLNGNRIQWSYEGEPAPDVVQVLITEPGFVPLPVWQIVLPGTESSVVVPPSVMEILREYSFLEILIITALSPRFDYDYFSYRQLGLGAWNSFTQEAQYFTVQ